MKLAMTFMISGRFQRGQKVPAKNIIGKVIALAAASALSASFTKFASTIPIPGKRREAAITNPTV